MERFNRHLVLAQRHGRRGETDVGTDLMRNSTHFAQISGLGGFGGRRTSRPTTCKPPETPEIAAERFVGPTAGVRHEAPPSSLRWSSPGVRWSASAGVWVRVR